MDNNFKLILSINDLSNESGGPSKALLSLSSHLISKGVDFRLIAKELSKLNPTYQKLSPLILQYQSQLRLSYKNFIVENKLLNLLENMDIDYPHTVVHDHGIWLPSNNTICSFARKKRLKLLISPHGTLDSWSFSQK